MPAGCAGPGQLSVTSKSASGKVVSITISNTGSSDAILNQLALSWPQATNGNLATIKLDGDTLYNNSTGVSSPQTIGVPPLTATVSKRTITANSSDVLTLTFKNNVDTNLTHYTGTASWDNGTPDLTLLPNHRQHVHSGEGRRKPALAVVRRRNRDYSAPTPLRHDGAGVREGDADGSGRGSGGLKCILE